MKRVEFVFECVHLLYYKCHKTIPNRGGPYIDFYSKIKTKKNNSKPINKKDNNYFQYASTVALNHEKIAGHTVAITKIKPFIDKYNWERMSYPSKKDD